MHDKFAEFDLVNGASVTDPALIWLCEPPSTLILPRNGY